MREGEGLEGEEVGKILFGMLYMQRLSENNKL